MAYRRLADHEEVKPDTLYRTTYFMGGPMPPKFLTDLASRAVSALDRLGQIEVQSQEWFPKEFADHLPDAPDRVGWAYRVTWKKGASGTPLAFFAGQGGILTVRLLTVLAVVVGFVIIARQTEELIRNVGEDVLSPGIVVGAVLLVGLFLMRK